MSQILTAQAVQEDIGEVQSTRCGIEQWSQCGVTHSERDVQKVIEKQGSTLGLPLSEMRIKGVTFPWIDPRTWLGFIVKKGLWPRLAGAPDANVSAQVWKQFWSTYEKLHPGFHIFDLENVDFENTAAFAIHGDEGRTLKKQGIMVTSIQSCLGNGFDEKRVGLDQGVCRPKVNFVSHSYTHRFVTSVIPKHFYDSDPEVFHGAMEYLALSLKDLFVTGFVDPTTGKTYRVAVIATKGDAPYLQKMGRLYRSFNTSVKRGDERREPKGICHRCLAGTSAFPAEEIATVSPKSWPTKGVKDPWIVLPEVLKHLMFDQADASSFFQSDIWHTVHLGFGRSWCASVITLTLKVIPRPNLDEKWSFLSGHYISWCRRNKRQAHISGITAHLVSYGDKTGCQGNWHKGSVTTNFMLWLLVLIADLPGDDGGLLRACAHATRLMNELFQCLYKADAFLSREQCDYVSSRGLEFLRIYNGLAVKMFADGKPWLFPLYPKLHVFHEMNLQIKFDGETPLTGTSFNPLVWGCQVDEDQIGRTARLSRRVSVRTQMQRTLERYLVNAYSAFVRAGLLR